MCQFCGVDPEFASFFDKDSEKSTMENNNPTSDAPNYFRLKPDHPRYTKLTTPQLTTFASKLSPQAQVLLSSHQGDEYTKASQRWSKQAIKSALAIVRVATPEDISKTIVMATSHKVPFVVKCGGHSPSGASSIENGIVIDLSLMRQVSVKPDEQVVIADGGCLYGDICKASAEYGLACVGGTTSHVGIGGLSLSGGYGYLTGEHGLAVDNIIGAQVVTADGKILWVNEKDHSDLFWGLRGAGNRLAVVTKFVFKAHRVPSQIWGGLIQFSGSQVEQVVEAINSWYQQKDVKAAAGVAFGSVADGKTGLTVFPFYNGSQADAETNFTPLLALSSLQRDVSSMPFWKINTLGDQPGAFSGAFIEFDSANVAPPLQPQHIKSMLDHLDQFTTKFDGDCNAGAYILLIQPDGISKHQTGDMAFPWRNDRFDIGLSTAWQHPDQAERCTTWLHQHFQPLANAQGDQDRLYSNHSDFRGPGTNEFGSNYTKVMELKSKWDPNNVFKSVL
ncbi:uncharacterized protein BX664DRAFT_331405 [Halteromyces radiatus]|uniref:uncharacterized protein n=1 Tax=Halteromyces radiatus TaxID=101107 RepID=UPI00221F5D58|nr:uncharacterized protein BX664DRAFT_331405 [Halteromyces radiatus]KAI8088800.1 hypothetical protein BX664DRAFT_331405 [Halteromyces radiatus]